MQQRTITPYIRKTDRGANKRREFAVQLAVARHLRQYFPHVDFMSDWAAGAYLTIDQAKKRKAINSGKGWADMFIPYPMTHKLPDGTEKTYHGLFIELKVEGTSIYAKTGPRKGKLSNNEQIQVEAAFLKRMNDLGYLAVFAIGYEKAVEIINRYFQVPENATIF